MRHLTDGGPVSCVRCSQLVRQHDCFSSMYFFTREKLIWILLGKSLLSPPVSMSRLLLIRVTVSAVIMWSRRIDPPRPRPRPRSQLLTSSHRSTEILTRPEIFLLKIKIWCPIYGGGYLIKNVIDIWLCPPLYSSLVSNHLIITFIMFLVPDSSSGSFNEHHLGFLGKIQDAI